MIISIPGIVSQGGLNIILPTKGGALNDYTWEEISLISSAGAADEYFAVGDRKAVTLDGRVRDLGVDITTYCYILGFDHNAALEGRNLIHFMFGFSDLTGGADMAFAPDNYGSRDAPEYNAEWIVMHPLETNAVGWVNTRMRNETLPQLKALFPTDLQSVIKPVTKYTYNITDTDAGIVATQEDLFFLSEYETFGTIKYANSAEQSYQVQYPYFAQTGARTKLQHNNRSRRAIWWLRSQDNVNPQQFMQVGATSAAAVARRPQTEVYAIAPAFCV